MKHLHEWLTLGYPNYILLNIQNALWTYCNSVVRSRTMLYLIQLWNFDAKREVAYNLKYKRVLTLHYDKKMMKILLILCLFLLGDCSAKNCLQIFAKR
jgi:hypothetical protein